MSATMRPPLVLDEHGDIQVFESVDELICEVELIDVRNQEYDVFDSEGRKLELTVAEHGVSKRLAYPSERHKIVLRCADPRPTHQDELKKRLLNFLHRVGEAVTEYENRPLENVLDRVRQVLRRGTR